MSETIQVAFLFPLIALFLILVIVKLITFILVARSLKSDKFRKKNRSWVKYDKIFLTIDGNLNRFMFLFPLVIVLLGSWLLIYFLITLYHSWTINLYFEKFVWQLYENINLRVIESLVGIRIIFLYTIAWIFFSRWKRNILHSFKLQYYSQNEDI
jgi:hypothetical protein